MNLNHLAVFHAVAEAGGVTAGAERLQISQPAASKQIDNLFAGLKAYHLAGLVWFDAIGRIDQTGKHKEFRLQTRPNDAAHYKEQLSRFLG